MFDVSHAASKMELMSTPPKRRSPRIDADKRCRTAAKQLASAVAERVWGLAIAPNGSEYYYHLATNATAWSLPPGAILQADGETYVSEQQHRCSPRSSPKAKASPSTRSPKGVSPKAKVGATGSPKSPKRRTSTATAAQQGEVPLNGPAAQAEPQGEPPAAPSSYRIEAGAEESQDAAGEVVAEEKAVEEVEEEADDDEGDTDDMEDEDKDEEVEAEAQAEAEAEAELTAMRTLLASVQGRLQQCEAQRAESAAELQQQRSGEAQTRRRLAQMCACPANALPRDPPNPPHSLLSLPPAPPFRRPTPAVHGGCS